MSDDLTPAERSLRARMGAYALHATHDPKETTRAARAALLSKDELAVDPDGVLPADERARRAEARRKQRMTALAYESAKARRLKRAA